MSSFPVFVRSVSPSGEARYVLGDPVVDRYLEFVGGRCRVNTLRAVAHDLKTFFSVIDKAPVEVTTVDVFEFLAHQRGDRSVIRIGDRESGLSARTIARRLSSISGFYAYFVARGDTPVRSNPVPRGIPTRRRGGRRHQVPLVRVPWTLPKVTVKNVFKSNAVARSVSGLDRPATNAKNRSISGSPNANLTSPEGETDRTRQGKVLIRECSQHPKTSPRNPELSPVY